MAWRKLEPIKPKMHGCLNCGEMIQEAPMDMEISVGFGCATVTKDGKTVYSEMESNTVWAVADAEREATKDPEHDWRIDLPGALRGRTFQRHGDGKWVLVREYDGFA